MMKNGRTALLHKVERIWLPCTKWRVKAQSKPPERALDQSSSRPMLSSSSRSQLDQIKKTHLPLKHETSICRGLSDHHRLVLCMLNRRGDTHLHGHQELLSSPDASEVQKNPAASRSDKGHGRVEAEGDLWMRPCMPQKDGGGDLRES